MWFHLEPKGAGYTGALSGVAVSDRAAGPYTFLRAGRPDAGVYPVNALPQHFGKSRAAGMRFDGGSLPEHPDSLNLVGRDAAQGQMARDMTLFVDDDGRAYHVYSSEENSTLHISELTDDYLAHSGRYARFFVGRFMEAPALFKRGGRYYLMMSGCTGWAPNAARSAVAESVWGPWRELGNPCEGPGAETTYDSQSTFVVAGTVRPTDSSSSTCGKTSFGVPSARMRPASITITRWARIASSRAKCAITRRSTRWTKDAASSRQGTLKRKTRSAKCSPTLYKMRRMRYNIT